MFVLQEMKYPFLKKWDYLFLAKIDDDASVTSSFLILVAWEMLFYQHSFMASSSRFQDHFSLALNLFLPSIFLQGRLKNMQKGITKS